MPKSKKRYLVFPNVDLTTRTNGIANTDYLRTFDTEEEALENAQSTTTPGYSSTIAVTTQLLKPKPVEMVIVNLTEEC